MIIRRSSEGYNVILYRNTSPGVTRARTYSNSTVEEDNESNYSKPSIMKNISPLTEDSSGQRIRRLKTTKGYRVNIHH